MLTRLLAVAAVAAAAGPASAQFLPAVPVYRPGPVIVTGVTPSPAYVVTNPYTGTVTRTVGAVDPFTGTYTQVGQSYNPYTGMTATNRQAFNPYNGATVVGTRVMNPAGGVFSRVVGGNLYTGQTYAYPARVPGFGVFR
jgi:hypothetical protein